LEKQRSMVHEKKGKGREKDGKVEREKGDEILI
jgi:hypothetical protein